MVTPARGIALAILIATVMACASREDATPMIVVSPGARERIMVMDRLRHHGAPRRILPRVTVEEVDESELLAPSAAAPDDTSAAAPDDTRAVAPDDARAGTDAAEPASPARDAGALED